jgi:hypothetical protein
MLNKIVEHGEQKARKNKQIYTQNKIVACGEHKYNIHGTKNMTVMETKAKGNKNIA